MKILGRLSHLLLATLALAPMAICAETLQLRFTAQAAATGAIQGTIDYSSNPADSILGSVPGEGPGYANYTFAGPAFRYAVSWTGGGIDAPTYILEVFDQGSLLLPTDFPTDTLIFGAKVANVGYSLLLTGANSSFSGQDLPTSAEITSPWTSARFLIKDFNAGTSELAQLTSLSVSAVPEPGSLWVLGLGLGVLGVGGVSRQCWSRCLDSSNYLPRRFARPEGLASPPHPGEIIHSGSED